jgi:hypothetical protein
MEDKVPTPEAQLRSFIDRLNPENQKLFRSVRSAVRKRFPTANELAYDYSSFVVIAYSPTEQGIEGMLSIAGRADGVDLYFTKGPQLPDPKKLLRGSAKQVRFIRLETARQLAHPDIKPLIDAAVRLASVPFPSKGKGKLIIKTNKMLAGKKKPRRQPSK